MSWILHLSRSWLDLLPRSDWEWGSHQHNCPEGKNCYLNWHGFSSLVFTMANTSICRNLLLDCFLLIKKKHIFLTSLSPFNVTNYFDLIKHGIVHIVLPGCCLYQSSHVRKNLICVLGICKKYFLFRSFCVLYLWTPYLFTFMLKIYILFFVFKCPDLQMFLSVTNAPLDFCILVLSSSVPPFLLLTLPRKVNASTSFRGVCYKLLIFSGWVERSVFWVVCFYYIASFLWAYSHPTI